MKKRILSTLLALTLALSLLPTAVLAETATHSHPVCGASCTHTDSHTGQTWTAWDADNAPPSSAGNYYLTADVTLGSDWTPADGTNLCLNGHTLTLAAKIIVSSGSTLTITDCGTTKGKILRAATNTTIALFDVQGRLDAYGIIIDGGEVVCTGEFAAALYVHGSGAAVTMADSTIQNCCKNKGVTHGSAIRLGYHRNGVTENDGEHVDLTNCTIRKNKSGHYGGAVFVGIKTTLTMTGGSLDQNETTSDHAASGYYTYGGGAIYNKGTVHLSGVAVTNNKSAGKGGALYNSSYGTLTVDGGTISGNTTNYGMGSGQTVGDGIFHSSRTELNSGSLLTIRGGAEIDDPIYLDARYAAKDVIIGSALTHDLYLVVANAEEGRVIAEGTDSYTISEDDMEKITVTGWNLKLDKEKNTITLTQDAAEADYLLVQLTSDRSDLTVTLTKGGTTSTLPYDPTATNKAYIGNVVEGSYVVKVAGIDGEIQTIEVTKDGENIFPLLPSVTITYAGTEAAVTVAKTGDTLQANVTNTPAITPLTYQWCYQDGTTAVPLTGSDTTGQTYTLKAEDVGKKIGVCVYKGNYNVTTNYVPVCFAWVDTGYTVTYNAGRYGSGSPATDNKIHGVALTLQGALFTREGYTQTGWAISDGGEKAYALGGRYTGNADVTLYPVWTANTYAITYHLDGGTNAVGNPSSYTYGTGVTSFADPTRTGYTFAGWYDAATGGNEVESIPATQKEAVTLYAKWTVIRYNITYQLNGGALANGVTNPSSYTVEDSITLANPTLSGYDFTGWSGTGLTGGNNMTVTIPTGSTEDREFSANWTRSTYTVTFNANGGTLPDGVANTATTDASGTLVSLPTPTRDGHTFNGWFTATTGGDQVTTDTVFTQSATIYAQWTKNSTTPSTPSGGRPTPSKPLYDVIVKDAPNGEADSNRDEARPGTIVTITVAPDSGYTLDDITVTDKDGNELEVNDLGGGKYSFIMPDSDVTVRPGFTDGSNTGFVDVPADKYYYDAVNWAVANGITGGIDGTHFAPDAPCTRGQMVTLLWRALGKPEAKTASNPFTDVKEGSAFYQAILWASENDIVVGYADGTFRPNDPVTRQQSAAILWRYAKYAGMDVSVGEDTNILSFDDALDIAEYAFPALQWAVGEGIMQGSHGNLLPRSTCTRAQIVTMLYRLLTE